MFDECCCIDAEGPDLDDDGEYLYDERMVTLTTDTACCECEARIAAGDQFQMTTGTWCGRESVYYTCKICAQIRRDLFKCGYTLGCLADELGDCYDLDLC